MWACVLYVALQVHGRHTPWGRDGSCECGGGQSFVSTDRARHVLPLVRVEWQGGEFPNFFSDGIVGLGLPGFAKVTKPTAFDRLAGDMSLPRVFSVYLTEGHNEQSTLVVGGYDLTLAAPNASVVWAPVQPVDGAFGYWAVSMTSFRLDDAEFGSHLELCSSGGCSAVIDTGTSFVAVAADLYTPLMQFIESAAPSGECTFASFDRFPTLVFSLAIGSAEHPGVEMVCVSVSVSVTVSVSVCVWRRLVCLGCLLTLFWPLCAVRLPHEAGALFTGARRCGTLLSVSA